MIYNFTIIFAEYLNNCCTDLTFQTIKHMFNKILWTLDNEIDGTKFEQLCTDLLAQSGLCGQS